MMSERKPKVLLIEDDGGDEMLTLRALRQYTSGVSVFVARDGEQAVQVIRLLGGQLEDYPSLILLDLNLPKVSGFEVLALVKGSPELAGIPVAIVTGDHDADTEAQCMNLGADAVLKKPVGYNEYLEMLRPIFIQTLGSVILAEADAVTLL